MTLIKKLKYKHYYTVLSHFCVCLATFVWDMLAFL